MQPMAILLPMSTPATPQIGDRVNVRGFGPATIMGDYDGPFGPSWIAQLEDGRRMAVTIRDLEA